GDLTFISIAEELGGFRQIGKVLPLLQQFSTAQAALNVAQNASNGLTKNAETAQASLAIRIIKVREEFLALVRSMTETPTFQIMANAALSLASALIKIADSIKPLLPLLGAVAAFRAVRGIGGFLGGVGAGLTSGRTFHSGGKVHAFATGGLVPGTGNSDTVPAMLTPGEFVIRKSSVAKLGAENLAHMNKGGLVQKFALGGQARKFGVASLLPMNNPPEEVQATIPVSSIRKYLAKKAGGKSIVKKGNLENVNNTIRGILGLKGQESIKTSAIAETMSRQDVASKIENRVELSIQKLIDNAASALGKSLSINVERKADNSIVKSVGSASTIGSVFEGALSMLGAPMDTGKGEQDPIDFPRGLGSNFANVFPSLSGIPVDAKRTASKKILKDTASRKAAAYLANAVYADPRWTMLSQNKEIKETSKPLVLAQAKRKSPAKISPIDPRRLVNFTSGQTYNFTDITAAGIQPSQANQEFEKLGSGKWRKKHFGGIIEHFAVGGNVGTDTVPALLTPGEFVVNKASAQRIGYGNLHRMNTVGKYAKGGVVQTFANGGTPTGGTRSVISNIPVPGFDTKAPTLLNKVIGQLTGTFSIVDIDLKKGSQQFKLLQTITPDLAKSLMDYAQASNLNVKQTGQLASAYSKLVGTMLMQGDKDSQIVASMQPYVDALKADTNAKLNSAKATAAIGPINATASKFPSPAPSASPAQTSLFPPIIKQPPSSPPSGPSGPTSSSSAVSANTTAIASNTQAQKSAAQSAIGVVRNNKMFAASMATSLIGGFLPAVDENSGAILRVTQSLFSMTTAIFGTLAALEAMNISLNKQTLSNMLDLFSGKGGAIASKVGQFAGNALGGT
ncbi:hypothetical protein EB077_11305, partial [bacterium]|nr:hypothetical protein [bacterium]